MLNENSKKLLNKIHLFSKVKGDCWVYATQEVQDKLSLTDPLRDVYKLISKEPMPSGDFINIPGCVTEIWEMCLNPCHITCRLRPNTDSVIEEIVSKASKLRKIRSAMKDEYWTTSFLPSFDNWPPTLEVTLVDFMAMFDLREQ